MTEPTGAVDGAPRLYRLRRGRLLGGVAVGLAAHLRLPVLAVRAAFVVLVLFNGLGVLLYAVFWAVLRRSADDGPPQRHRLLALAAFAPLVFVLLVLRTEVVGSQPPMFTLAWLFAIVAVGAGIIWHQTATDRKGDSDGDGDSDVGSPGRLAVVLTGPGRRAYLLRFVGGGTLVVIGMVGLTAAYSPVTGGGVLAVLNGLLFTVTALTGIGLVAAPLLWRTFGALREEREARIREQERAEFAAMVHDQVLHTLALIQRNAATGTTAHRLARSQERTLRNWLYKSTGSPSERFAAALEHAAGEVEDTYGLTVEVVVVGGDLRTCEQVQALVSAAREALVNAGRHAEVSTVSVYAEVEPGQVHVFVRDRGVGFDPASVDPRRHGVRGSIIGRMQRHGGEATIHSTPGEGTEVRLRLPLPTGRTNGSAAPETGAQERPDAVPGDAGPGDAGPGDAGPGDAGPGDAGVGHAGVGDAGAGDGAAQRTGGRAG